eukprot:s463_g2.t1
MVSMGSSTGDVPEGEIMMTLVLASTTVHQVHLLSAQRGCEAAQRDAPGEHGTPCTLLTGWTTLARCVGS